MASVLLGASTEAPVQSALARRQELAARVAKTVNSFDRAPSQELKRFGVDCGGLVGAISTWTDYTGKYWRDGQGTPFKWYHTENGGRNVASYLPSCLSVLRENQTKQTGAQPNSFKCAVRVAERFLEGKKELEKDDTPRMDVPAALAATATAKRPRLLRVASVTTGASVGARTQRTLGRSVLKLEGQVDNLSKKGKLN